MDLMNRATTEPEEPNMNTSNTTPVFQTRTGLIHRRFEGSRNALPCNSRNYGFKGTPGDMTDNQLAQAKKCAKCFPQIQVGA